MKKILIVFLLLSITSCNSTRKVMDSWLNSSKQQLIMSWGPPTKSASDGGDGEILVYSKHIYIPATQYINAQKYWDNKYFYVNSSGKIYHWMTKREQIPPQQIDLNINRRY